MRRLLLIPVLAGMIFGLAGGADGVAADKGETCTKVRHSKIVWVKVKRGGKWVRVKHRKVWWSCDTYEAPGPPRLGVIAREYRFTFTRPYVKAGKLILQLDNQGEDVHNLKIGKVSSKLAFAVVPDTEPRAQSTIEVPLKPGTYRLWCSLPKHEKLGMKTTLKVVARDH